MILLNYLDKSSCNLNYCPYGDEFCCDECIVKMLEEYMETVRANVIDECIKIVHEYFKQALDDNPRWSMSEMDRYAFIPNKNICNEMEKLKEDTNECN